MGVTRDVAEFVVRTGFSDLPPEIVHEAKRDIVNIFGVAIYSAVDPSLKLLLDVFDAEGANKRARVWGTGYRTSLQNAALANGYIAHFEDNDDTHFPTIIHPSAPTVSAAFPIAEDAGASGRDLVTAVALGIEMCCRIGLSLHPWHYDEGWHITGTMGVFGSSLAAGKLLGLDAAQMVAAMGIAGTQAAGVREVFGSMSKPMHAGRAAQAGVLAAMLARSGFTSTEQILEGRRGIGAVLSGDRDLARATADLGKRWEIKNNGLKPYSCGVVSHPSIDAAIELRGRPGFNADAIESIEATVHPLVPELMGKTDLKVGLEGKFSVYHCIAVGLVDGAAFPEQFSDAKVHDPRLAALRSKIRLVVDVKLPEDESHLSITLRDGTKLEHHVEHATGAPENPLSDARLNDKFMALATHTLSEPNAKALLDRLWHIDAIDDVSKVLG